MIIVDNLSFSLCSRCFFFLCVFRLFRLFYSIQASASVIQFCNKLGDILVLLASQSRLRGFKQVINVERGLGHMLRGWHFSCIRRFRPLSHHLSIAAIRGEDLATENGESLTSSACLRH